MFKKLFKSFFISEEELKKEKERGETLRQSLDNELKAKQLLMSKTYCPIIKQNCQSEDCIHYDPGRASVWYSDLYQDYLTTLRAPRCKLWRLEMKTSKVSGLGSIDISNLGSSSITVADFGDKITVPLPIRFYWRFKKEIDPETWERARIEVNKFLNFAEESMVVTSDNYGVKLRYTFHYNTCLLSSFVIVNYTRNRRGGYLVPTDESVRIWVIGTFILLQYYFGRDKFNIYCDDWQEKFRPALKAIAKYIDPAIAVEFVL